ncbi:MAG: hypothetical protein M0D57_13115 [Sphingobacteriales bacterium JAD_PAG50586_3]|nr:MAG: hypothetical protein M0D57_13115 [Sphingobacteriales bacterium JAD_PAG50586_3]
MRKALFILILLAIAFAGKAQSLGDLEAQMSTIAPSILKGESDSVRTASNNQFILLLEKAFGMPNSFDHPFDSLKTISRLQPDDKSFKLFTWNMPKDDGTFVYFGYVHMKDPSTGAYKFVKLIDKSSEIQSPETKALTPKNWYGTHYYKIVQTTYKKEKFYTLLGIDFNNRATKKKIIDVIAFDRLGNVFFGDNIFEYDKKSPKRIIFEYSAQATMSLRFDDARNMIVFDHLSPIREDFTGHKDNYGPDFSYDALKFKKAKWVHLTDIDARNIKKPVDNSKQQRPNMGLDRNAPNPNTQ